MNIVFYLYVNSTSIKLWSYHELLAYKKCTIILLSLYRFSNGGTKSVLHTDSYENLHCLASGIKEFVLIEPSYSEIIGPEHKDLGYYHIDVERFTHYMLNTVCTYVHYNVEIIEVNLMTTEQVKMLPLVTEYVTNGYQCLLLNCQISNHCTVNNMGVAIGYHWCWDIQLVSCWHDPIDIDVLLEGI